MKKLIAIVMLAAFISCRKNTEDKTDSNNQLTGVWELHMHWFGYGGSETFPVGNNNRIIFNDARQYLATGSHNLLNGSGTYTFSTWVSPQGISGNLLRFDSLQEANGTYYSYQSEVHIYNDTLRLDRFSTSYDFPVFFYVKR